jgi:hypothetical protein
MFSLDRQPACDAHAGEERERHRPRPADQVREAQALEERSRPRCAALPYLNFTCASAQLLEQVGCLRENRDSLLEVPRYRKLHEPCADAGVFRCRVGDVDKGVARKSSIDPAEQISGGGIERHQLAAAAALLRAKVVQPLAGGVKFSM